jgi:hypothetical protein
MKAETINIKNYDGDELGEFSIGMIARSMSVEQFTELYNDFLNLGGKGYLSGQAVGEQLRFTHRTLQRSAIAFALGIIIGISDQKYTDARNETAISTAKKIKELMDNGEIPLGPYV